MLLSLLLAVTLRSNVCHFFYFLCINEKEELVGIKKEFCDKLKRASPSKNFEEMLNLFYELNILKKFIKSSFPDEKR